MSKVKIPRLGASPKASSKNVSKVMKANKASGTKIEVVFKDVLRREGLKNFTSNPKNVIGRPDIAFVKYSIAVFIHGCFWHHHVGCPRATIPKRNRSFWVGKFKENGARDRRKIRALREKGFSVFVIWECQTAREPKLKKFVERVMAATKMAAE